MSHLRPVGGLSLALAGLFAAIVLTTLAQAQSSYKSDPVDESVKRSGLVAKRFAKSPSNNAEERQRFEKYVFDYYLPEMTRATPQALGELAKNRYDFVRNFLWQADPSVQKLLTPRVMTKMGAIVTDNGYHPAVRYNAILIIGLLDSTYGVVGGAAPMPMSEANALLTKIVDLGTKSETVPAPILVGALIGLERHARYLENLPAANRASTVSALMAVLQADSLPQEMASSVEQWLKIIAARGLARIGQLGDGNVVHQNIFTAIANEKYRLDNRVAFANLLDRFKTAYAAASIDERQATKTLLQLASDIAADEKERAKKYEEESLRGMTDSFDSSGVELPDRYQVRRLVMRLRGLRTALRVVAPAIKDANLSGLLGQVDAAIGPVLTTAENKNMIELNLAGDVKVMADTIIATSSSLGVEAAEIPTEEEELEEDLLGE